MKDSYYVEILFRIHKLFQNKNQIKLSHNELEQIIYLKNWQNKCLFFNVIGKQQQQSAIDQCLKFQYYRELVSLNELGSPQPLEKFWHFWGHTKGGFEGVGEFVWNFKFSFSGSGQ